MDTNTKENPETMFTITAKWRGVRSYSVALQDHSGACNQERRHQGKQECARRIRQIQRMNMKSICRCLILLGRG